MQKGNHYKLSPFKRSADMAGTASAMANARLFEEEVVYIGHSITGNAIIRDNRKRRRLCNPQHLYKIE